MFRPAAPHASTRRTPCATIDSGAGHRPTKTFLERPSRSALFCAVFEGVAKSSGVNRQRLVAVDTAGACPDSFHGTLVISLIEPAALDRPHPRSRAIPPSPRPRERISVLAFPRRAGVPRVRSRADYDGGARRGARLTRLLAGRERRCGLAAGGDSRLLWRGYKVRQCRCSICSRPRRPRRRCASRPNSELYRPLWLDVHIECTRLNSSRTLDLHKEPVVSGFRQPVRK